MESHSRRSLRYLTGREDSTICRHVYDQMEIPACRPVEDIHGARILCSARRFGHHGHISRYREVSSRTARPDAICRNTASPRADFNSCGFPPRRTTQSSDDAAGQPGSTSVFATREWRRA